MKSRIAVALVLVLSILVVPVCKAGMGLCEMPDEDYLLQRGFRLIGENTDDKFSEIEGPETTIRVYWKKGEKVGLYVLPNEEIYAYAIKKDNQPMITYVDEDNDSYCDRTIEAMEDFEINFYAYGITLE